MKCRHKAYLHVALFFSFLCLCFFFFVGTGGITRTWEKNMAELLILNKADFQRHLNGCERRLTNFSKSIQTIGNALTKQQVVDDDRCREQMKKIYLEEKRLYSILSSLDQSAFAATGRKRLDLLKSNLERQRIEFERIRSVCGYPFEPLDLEPLESTDQLRQLLKHRSNEIELDFIDHTTAVVGRLERDLTDLRGTFVDLNRIIHEQGAMVNNIEHALTEADQMVAEATEQVEATVQEKRRSTRTQWIVIGSVGSIFLLLFFIIYLIWKLVFPSIRN